MSVTTYGTDSIMKMRLRQKVRSIMSDDRVIIEEVNTLLLG